MKPAITAAPTLFNALLLCSLSVCSLAVCSLSVCPLASAAETLTWDRCISMTASGNAEIRAARATLESSFSGEGGARSGYYPQVSGNLGYSYGNTSSSTFTSNPTTNTTGLSSGTSNTQKTYSANLSASENLFNGFQDQAKVRQAEASTRSSDASLRITQAKVSLDLATAFEGLVYAKSNETLAADTIKRRQSDLQMVQLRFQGGMENKGSVMLSQAYLEQARYDELQARDASDVARTSLAKVLGLEDLDGYDIAGDVPVSDPPPAPDFPKLAIATPEHLQSVAQEDSADAAVTIARSAFFPSFNLTGTFSRTGQAFFPNDQQRWTVGAGLSFPFFSGGKDFYSVQSSASLREVAAENRFTTDRQELVKLKQAFTGYVEAVRKLKVDQTFLEAAKVRAEIGRNKYNNGLLTFEDWDLIENDLIARQKTELQSRRDRVVAEATWKQALGKGVIP